MNRRVRVVLSENMVAGVKCLLQNRNEVGVDKANPFMFAHSSGLNSVDSHSCLKRVVGSIKLDRPDLVISTYLRKYIAMVSQLLDMKPNEFELVCKYMGHSAFVHTHTNTHTYIVLLFWNLSGTTRVSRYQKGENRKVKTNLDLLEQETVSGSGICWAICNAYSL